MWSISKALHIPLDESLVGLPLRHYPYTISYIIRKRQQIDNLMELPKDKRPPDSIIWSNNSNDIDDWLDKVFDRKQVKEKDTTQVMIPLNQIE